MTTPPHILLVGNNLILMSSRSLILRNAGYLVQEAYTVDKAITSVRYWHSRTSGRHLDSV